MAELLPLDMSCEFQVAQNDNIVDITKIVNVSVENIQFVANTTKVVPTVSEVVRVANQLPDFYSKV